MKDGSWFGRDGTQGKKGGGKWACAASKREAEQRRELLKTRKRQLYSRE